MFADELNNAVLFAVMGMIIVALLGGWLDQRRQMDELRARTREQITRTRQEANRRVRRMSTRYSAMESSNAAAADAAISELREQIEELKRRMKIKDQLIENLQRARQEEGA